MPHNYVLYVEFLARYILRHAGADFVEILFAKRVGFTEPHHIFVLAGRPLQQRIYLLASALCTGGALLKRSICC